MPPQEASKWSGYAKELEVPLVALFEAEASNGDISENHKGSAGERASEILDSLERLKRSLDQAQEEAMAQARAHPTPAQEAANLRGEIKALRANTKGMEETLARQRALLKGWGDKFADATREGRDVLLEAHPE